MSSSQASGFPFSARFNTQPAPLFYSATDEFRENNDEEEHEQELADYYALQKSRRQLGGRLDASSEGEDENPSLQGSEDSRGADQRGFGRGGGIRSSWRGERRSEMVRSKKIDRINEQLEGDANDGKSEGSSRGQGKMVDVGLGDTLRSDFDDEDDGQDYVDDPPSIQEFRKPSRSGYQDESQFISDTDRDALLDQSPTSPNDAPALMVPGLFAEPPRHDIFWGHLYLLCFAATFATWFLVFLHTEAPGKKHPLGDTIYTALHGSFHLLAIYTLVSIFISLLWLAALHSYARPVVYAILVAVPVILYSFSLHTFVSSFRGSYQGASIQDKVMRWAALIPSILASLWIFSALRGRHSLHKAISILEFATRILAVNPALLAQGFAVLAAIVTWTWVWLSMFTRVFLGGHLATRSSLARFVIDTSTWWLGVYFILMYLWTIGMIFSIQRAVTSATVSQWYFHRLAKLAPTSLTIVQAALSHALSTLFGTIALSSGLNVLVRLPLLLFPRRLSLFISAIAYSVIPTPLVALTHSLTLTYAAIHSQPLTTSARGLSSLASLRPALSPSLLSPTSFAQHPHNNLHSPTLLPYRLAKLLLHATRFLMALALGLGGWVHTSRSLKLLGVASGVRGSLYAYIVGLVAGAIGWGVLGSMEGVVAGVVDGVVVCWASEVGSGRGRERGEARYCREAGWLFGEEDGGGGGLGDVEGERVEEDRGEGGRERERERERGAIVL